MPEIVVRYTPHGTVGMTPLLMLAMFDDAGPEDETGLLDWLAPTLLLMGPGCALDEMGPTVLLMEPGCALDEIGEPDELDAGVELDAVMGEE